MIKCQPAKEKEIIVDKKMGREKVCMELNRRRRNIMLITAWIIGILIFIFSLISLGGTLFLILLFFGGLMALLVNTGFDPFSYLGEDDLNMLVGAIVGPWVLVFVLTALGGIFGFAEDVGKAVKNLADDERKRY